MAFRHIEWEPTLSIPVARQQSAYLEIHEVAIEKPQPATKCNHGYSASWAKYIMDPGSSMSVIFMT